ncbi:hypothetical protein AB4Y86_07730 [Arthrobacter sp. 2YAF22_2]|uniref:sunset domain-containing protein n=1 Tax=Arthrobacter sp. 2YAF22_2 TaxID=3233029 RepID=UPI003F910CA5
MDWIIWLIVIVVIVGVVWWLLNRNNSRGAAGTSTSAGSGSAASPQAPPGPEKHDGALSGGNAAASAVAAATTGIPSAAGFGNAEPVSPTTADDQAAAGEWETQWSETPPAEVPASTHHDVPRGAHAAHVADTAQPSDVETKAGATTALPDETASPEAGAPAQHAPVHHPEYTEPHSPTLPGAESAAAEAAEVETAQATSSAAASEGAASHTAAPAGHLAVEQPYGEGSAAPGPDGSGPEGFTVKGTASSMTYHDETSPSYQETRAEVWFLSAAHAEAAGFRPPRRSRL